MDLFMLQQVALDVVLSESETVKKWDKLLYLLFTGIETSIAETEVLVQIYAHVRV